MSGLTFTQPPGMSELERELAAMVAGRGRLRAAGYTRVSSLIQVEEGNSLDDQAARIGRAVAEHGWELVGIYADAACSGRHEQRPQLARLLRAVRQNRVDVVVIDRIDRLSRNLFGLLSTVQYLARHRVQLVSLRESIDFTTPWGRLVLYVLGALAEFYVTALAEEIRLSRLQRARNGYLSGTYRFGYCNGRCGACSDPNGPGYCPLVGGHNRSVDGTRVPHPIEAEAVRLMFQWYASGEYSDDDVARRLNGEVFTLADGTEVRFRTKGLPGVHAPQAFDRDAVQAILTNPIYAGYVTYAGSDEQGRRRRKPVEWFVGWHQAIVSLELFRRVQAIRRNRYHRTTCLHNPARVYPLTGVLYCAAQHSPLRGISSNGGDSRYYVDRLCQQRLPRSEWHQPNLRAEWIEQQVQELVTSIHLPAAWRERILSYLFYDEGTDEIEREKVAIRERLRRAQELYRDRDYTREQLERVRSACVRDLKALVPASTPAGGEALALLDDLPALWSALTAEEQKTLYRLIFSAIEVSGQRIVAVEARGPFRPLLAEAMARLEQGPVCGSSTYGPAAATRGSWGPAAGRV
jgi:DNA invertase Pin-like site-specific DNA recombinase